LVSAPTGAIAVLVTPLAARLMSRFDARLVATIAFAASALSYFLRASLTADASFMAIALPLMVQGISSGTFFIATVSIVLDGIPPEKIPSAAGLSNFARIIASGFAVSLVTTFWDRREALHQSRMAELTSNFTPAFNTMLASLDMFTVSAWLCLAAIAIVWLCRKASPHSPPAALD
jgi:DHA2 family multidrug resistance protein